MAENLEKLDCKVKKIISSLLRFQAGCTRMQRVVGPLKEVMKPGVYSGLDYGVDSGLTNYLT